MTLPAHVINFVMCEAWTTVSKTLVITDAVQHADVLIAEYSATTSYVIDVYCNASVEDVNADCPTYVFVTTTMTRVRLVSRCNCIVDK